MNSLSQKSRTICKEESRHDYKLMENQSTIWNFLKKDNEEKSNDTRMWQWLENSTLKMEKERVFFVIQEQALCTFF